MASVLQEPSGEERNWAELPWDVLSVIFEKLGAFEVLITAQVVCRPWWRLSLEPRVWQCVDLVRGVSDLYGGEYDAEKMARTAVDRSLGQLVEFSVRDIGNDDLLQYVADRTTLLRYLRLVSCSVSDYGLIELAKKFPMLEELEVSYCSFSKETFESVGHSCPQLKCFRLNSTRYKHLHVECDDEALAIAENMPELWQLQLFGNKLTNDGLQAILDGCPNLKSLDLRHCFNVNLHGSLLKRCERIRELRLPYDSTTDYLYLADMSEFESGDDCSFDQYDYDDYLFGYSDLDIMYDDMFYDHSDGSIDDGEYLF